MDYRSKSSWGRFGEIKSSWKVINYLAFVIWHAYLGVPVAPDDPRTKCVPSFSKWAVVVIIYIIIQK